MLKDVTYQSYWKLTEEEKDQLLSDFGVVETTAQINTDNSTVVNVKPIDSEELDFFPGEFINSYVIFNGEFYPTYLKKNDDKEYVDIPQMVLDAEKELLEEETNNDSAE